jgi:hypothetical protein
MHQCCKNQQNRQGPVTFHQPVNAETNYVIENQNIHDSDLLKLEIALSLRFDCGG